MTDNKMDCDERFVSDRNLIVNLIPCKVEIDVVDITIDTDDSVSAISSSVSLPVDSDSSKTPLIFNEKYFKIIKKIVVTKHQKSATGILASCQLCAQPKTIRGSLKITSNFIQHLKSQHNLQYQEYVVEKQRETKKFSIEEDEKRPSSQYTFGPDDSSENLALIFNGEYFKIIEKFGNTDHQKSACGVIAACQLCPNNTRVKGSLRITSNFVQHLRLKHPEHFYKNYLIKKKIEGRRPRRLYKQLNENSSVSLGAISSVGSPLALSADVDSLQNKLQEKQYEQSIQIEDPPDKGAFADISYVDFKEAILPLEEDPLTSDNALSANSSHLILPMNAANSGITASMPLIFAGKYFKIISKFGETDHQRAAKCIIANCQLCAKPTKISGSLKSPSNFVEHLKRQHRSDYETYLIEKITTEENPLQHCNNDTSSYSASCSLKMSPESVLAKYRKHSVGLTEADCDISMRKALIFSGEYFKIIRKVGYTAHERAATGIIAVCQICKPNKKIKGSLKITSNFVQHLRRKHPQRYATYLHEKAFYDRCTVKQQQQQSDGSSFINIYRGSRSVLPTNADFTISKTMPIILNGEFFRIIKKLDHTAHQRKTRGIIADCQLCIPPRRLKGSMLIRSNFVEHLKRKHPSHYQLYVEKNNAKDKYRIAEADELIDKISTTASELSSSSNHSESILPAVHVDPDESVKEKEIYARPDFNEKLLAFFADSFLPLSVAENPSFRSLFGDHSLEGCHRRHLAHLMQTKYTHLKADIKERLQNVPYVCTTADIWSSRKRFFFGYTCHWIDSNLKRQSAALACRNLNGYHQLDQITDLIYSINADFGLDAEKVVCTIAGNGGNFLKPFKEWGIKDNYEINEDDSFDEDSDNVIDFVSDQPGFSIRIPKNYKCGSQTLIEFATTDFTNVLKANSTIYEIHQTSLHRCSSIWDKCNRPETVEITKNLLSRTLRTPNSACWNSLFDSLKDLIQCKRNLGDICSALGVPRFTPTEVLYIEEFCLLMEPISLALEFLQNEKDIFYGYFLPILVSTKVKLRKLYESGNLSYLRDIAKQMEMALVKRFRNFFEISPDCYDSVISAIACPSIKMRFSKPLQETTTNASLEDLKFIFIRHAKEFQTEVEFATQTEAASVDIYFDFDETAEETAHQHSKTSLVDVRRELERYLEDEDCTLDCLRRYPIIRKTFMKYNTPLPSSSPVERLLSFEGIANRQRRQHLSDEHFERIVIMGANKIFDFN